MLPFELRSHSKSVELINEVLSRCTRKNDLFSKLALRLRLEFDKKTMSGSHLLSHTVSSAVPSAAQALTFVFGMRTGVTPGRIATRRILAFHLATFDPNQLELTSFILARVWLEIVSSLSKMSESKLSHFLPLGNKVARLIPKQ